MKKTIVVLTALAAACSVYAQGRINFANNASPVESLINLNATTTGGGISLMSGAAASFRFQLFIADDGPAGSANWVDTGITNANSALLGAGRISNRNSVDVGRPVGEWVLVQVRGWSKGLGLTWAEALANKDSAPPTEFIGISPVGRVQLAASTSPGPTIFVGGNAPAGTIQISGFQLVPVPEPSTIALVGLGLAGLIFIRRRK
jgi:hypothetical protein